MANICTVSERRVWGLRHSSPSSTNMATGNSPLIGDQIIHRIWWIGMTYDIYIYI